MTVCPWPVRVSGEFASVQCITSLSNDLFRVILAFVIQPNKGHVGLFLPGLSVSSCFDQASIHLSMCVMFKYLHSQFLWFLRPIFCPQDQLQTMFTSSLCSQLLTENSKGCKKGPQTSWWPTYMFEERMDSRAEPGFEKLGWCYYALLRSTPVRLSDKPYISHALFSPSFCSAEAQGDLLTDTFRINTGTHRSSMPRVRVSAFTVYYKTSNAFPEKDSERSRPTAYYPHPYSHVEAASGTLTHWLRSRDGEISCPSEKYSISSMV